MLVGVKVASPLVVGVGDGESILASDIPAVLGRTTTVIPVDEGRIVEVRADGATFSDFDGNPAHPEADRGRLGRRPGGEGRLRHVHAEGDPRATERDPRHARRARRRVPAAGARRPPDPRRRPAGGRQGVRGRVRDGLPLGSRGEIRDRALDAVARRDRDRERVPLPRSGARTRHAHAGGLAVGGDDRHARGGAPRAAPGLPAARGDEHGGVLARPRGRRRDLHARRSGDRRRGDQDVRDPDGVAVPPRDVPGAGAGLDVPRGGRGGPDEDGGAAGAGRARDRARRAGAGDGGAVPATRGTGSSSGGTPATRPRSRER